MNHPTEYKNFSIEPSELGYRPCYIFYPTDQGPQDDGEYEDGSFRYTGNCKWADSLSEAKLLIDEIVPFYVETMNPVSRKMNITKFDYLSDAIKFAGRFNGELSVQFTNP